MATLLDISAFSWAKCWDFQHVNETNPSTGVVMTAPQECERSVLPADFEAGEYEFDGTIMYLGPNDILVRHMNPDGSRERYEGHTRESYEANFRRVQFPTGI